MVATEFDTVRCDQVGETARTEYEKLLIVTCQVRKWMVFLLVSRWRRAVVRYRSSATDGKACSRRPRRAAARAACADGPSRTVRAMR
jgi:hypothetical protein